MSLEILKHIKGLSNRHKLFFGFIGTLNARKWIIILFLSGQSWIALTSEKSISS